MRLVNIPVYGVLKVGSLFNRVLQFFEISTKAYGNYKIWINMSRSNFVKKHLELINVEKNEELEVQKDFLETLSLSTLQRKGLCISKVKVGSYRTGLYGRSIVKFEPSWIGESFPSHSLSSGDIAGVWAPNSGKREILENGVVTKATNLSIQVSFEKEFENLDLDEEMTYSLLKITNDVTYQRMKRALKSLDKYYDGVAYSMIEVLFANEEPRKISLGENFDEKFNINLPNLNESQIEAVKLALIQREVAIIHGPPGTGKTTTLVEIILQAVKRGSKILVCAPSNIAVDNVLEKLANYKVKMVRLGHPARVLPSTQSYSLDHILSRCDDSQVINELRQEIDHINDKALKKKKSERNYRRGEERKKLMNELKTRETNAMASVLKLADIILSTLVGASDDGPLKHLPKDHFHLVMIDECSQALEAACWIPLLKAPKCILAGDHLQLPPTIFSKKAAEEGLEFSLMERLVKMSEAKVEAETSIVKLLNIQYRMNHDIMKFSSTAFYHDKLIADPSVASHLLKDLPGVEENDITATALFLIDTAGCDMFELELEEGDSKGNEGEADLVSIHVENLIRSGVNAKDIAVIAPYNLQVELIRHRLSPKYPTLEIRSVDGFQGREKEVVVLTLVRSNKQGQVGFLAEDRRINVAITRAKRHLAIICDSVTVSRHEFLKSLINYLNSHGEVHSANQYNSELNEAETTRPEHLKLKKPGKKTCATKTSSINQSKAPKEKNGIGAKVKVSSKQDSTEDNQSLKFKNSGLNKEEQLEVNNRKRVEFENAILSFLAKNDETRFEFPSTLTSFDRMLIHDIAENLGTLKHISEGEGETRHIVLYKETKKGMDIEMVDDGTTKRKTPMTTKHPSTDVSVTDFQPKEKQCKKCLKFVPENNYTLHVNFCQKVAKKSQVSKPQRNISNSKDEDIDTILDNVIQAKNICAFGKCKTSITLMGQICQFCKEKFCLSHHMAEVHGCGDDAKAQARSSIRKEVQQCHKEPAKKLDSVKRVHVQRKLDKKLEELANQRKTKR